MIVNFFIKRLHGYKDVNIDFSSPYMVLLAENGQGKTTILNLLHGCLYGEFEKINRINFEFAVITFDDRDPIRVVKRESEVPVEEEVQGRAHNYFKRTLDAPKYRFLLSIARDGQAAPGLHRRFKARFGRSLNTVALKDLVEEVSSTDPRAYSSINAPQVAIQEVNEKFNSKPLYLPTFRRIEEDLVRLGLDEIEVPEGTINFGIQDVRKRLDDIQKEVLLSSNECFSRINGEILGKLISGFEVGSEDLNKVASLEDIDIVLERIGKNISPDDKFEINRLFVSGELLRDKKYESLVYFLSNMMTVYEQQKTNDIAVKEFAKKCQKYLIEKDISYNESTLSVSVKNSITQDDVPLEQFSSGEKQIVSLFAKLYLGGEQNVVSNNFAIFYDEPELSLSVEWQQMLLPDVIGSGRCDFLFAVTHSPFILRDVKEHARDLSRFVTVSKV